MVKITRTLIDVNTRIHRLKINIKLTTVTTQSAKKKIRPSLKAIEISRFTITV